MSQVVILGASAKPHRYAYKAQQALLAAGHQVHLVSPRWQDINGLPVLRQLVDIPTAVDTVTLYVNPTILQGYLEQLIQITPRRVIFNPGTESDTIAVQLETAGIATIEACTLVLLRTDTFDISSG